MIEKPKLIANPRREVILVAIVSLLSLYFILAYPFNLGLDLSGGTQLIYEVDVETAQKQGAIPKSSTVEEVMAQTLPVIDERVNPGGVVEAVVVRRGENEIVVELPKMSDEEAQQVEQRIQSLGSLEMRITATDDFNDKGVTFKLTEEKKRLEEWLKKEDNKKRVLEDPLAIVQYHSLASDQGGPIAPATGGMKWYPRKIRRDFKNKQVWDPYVFSQRGETFAVAVFDPSEYQAGPDAKNKVVSEHLAPQERELPDTFRQRLIEERTFLLEYVPVNTVEESFKGEDLNAAAVRPTIDPHTGGPAVGYEMNEENKSRYAEFSERYRNKPSAIILNGYLHSAPVFQGRIYGPGIITGGFTQAEANELVKVLKTGSLRVKPTRTSKFEIGPQLGKHAIKLGIISIFIGAVLVLAFIILYYRTTGLVAFFGLSLNVLMLIGIMQFVRATWTLPGLAGIVLTIGMSVDSNILIYERIKEEVKRGKQLLQAVAAGFDRALGVIIDTHVTTFLSGLVLYQVGIGPIKGYAVTLMIGVASTVFTSFFVVRMILHYLLAWGIYKEHRQAEWFSKMDVNWLRYSKPVALASVLVCILGVVYFMVMPKEKILGLDFTGGASMRVVLKEPTTAATVLQRIEAHPSTGKDFANPQVNTAGTSDDGKHNQFSVKIKLTNEQRAKIQNERHAAKAAGLDYEPPYSQAIEQALADLLVAKAADQPVLVPDPAAPKINQYATLGLHFQRPVEIAALQGRLSQKLRAVVVRPIGNAAGTQATDVFVDYQTAAERPASLIFSEVYDAIGDKFTDASGKKLELSKPILEANEIGGRIVGDLRNAAIGAMLIMWFLIIMYIRVRFHEYKYGITAVLALVHDVLVAFAFVVFFHSLGLVEAELDLAMIAAFLTIIGYSVNDKIVIFDRIRENIGEQVRLGDSKESFAELVNRSINQTMSRTILTGGALLFVLIAQFVINYGTGSTLSGFAFALLVGFIAGTYSTIFIAAPAVLWARRFEQRQQTAVTPTTGPATAS